MQNDISKISGYSDEITDTLMIQYTIYIFYISCCLWHILWAYKELQSHLQAVIITVTEICISDVNGDSWNSSRNHKCFTDKLLTLYSSVNINSEHNKGKR
jgi:hypothetical protein